jgi:hypothetical protein
MEYPLPPVYLEGRINCTINCEFYAEVKRYKKVKVKQKIYKAYFFQACRIMGKIKRDSKINC